MNGNESVAFLIIRFPDKKQRYKTTKKGGKHKLTALSISLPSEGQSNVTMR